MARCTICLARGPPTPRATPISAKVALPRHMSRAFACFGQSGCGPSIVTMCQLRHRVAQHTRGDSGTNANPHRRLIRHSRRSLVRLLAFPAPLRSSIERGLELRLRRLRLFLDGRTGRRTGSSSARHGTALPSAPVCVTMPAPRRLASSSLRYSSAGASSARRCGALMGQANKRNRLPKAAAGGTLRRRAWSERASSFRAAAQPKSARPIDFCHDFQPIVSPSATGARNCQCFRHASSSGLQRQRCR